MVWCAGQFSVTPLKASAWQGRSQELHFSDPLSPYGSQVPGAREGHSRETWKVEKKEVLVIL